MEQGYLYPFGSFFAHALQDNSDLFWYPLNAYNAPTPPITISMSTTRIVSPPAAAGIGVGALLSNPNSNPSPNPNSASHSHSHQSRSRSRAQRPIHLGIDEQVGGGGGAGSQRIRPTASLPLPLPFTLPLPPLMSTSRRRHRRSSTPTITTQQPRLSATPPPPQNNTQTPPRLRSTNLSLANVELPPINFWESEPLESHHGSGLEPSGFDDNFLLDLATAEFSSPSTYPSFTDFDSQPTQAQGVDQSHRQNRYSTLQAPTSPEPSRAFLNGASNAPRRLSTNCISNILGPERSTTQLSSTTNATGESQSTLPFFDSLEENDFLFDSPASSFSDAMPPATRRTTTAATAAARAGSGHASKRRRTSATAANTISTRPPSRQKKTPAPSKDMEVEELFGPSPTRTFVDLEAKEEDIDTVDLTETNEVLDDPKTPEKDNRIKLAAFQCVICMDDCVNLTVTHCGHLYCASCLHQSLHVDATKGKCPMCRQKLDMRQRNNYNSKTKGYWPLELKLMTATRKGKRKANTLA